MECPNGEYQDIAERAKVLGVHKQGSHKLCHFFIVMVTWSDNSQVTVYRKWRHIKEFQREIIRSLKDSRGNAEPMKYLKKTAQRVREIARSSRGTMGKLRMIDSLNDFFAAATHYKELANLKMLQQFFRPNETDMSAALWSKTGKTYLYVPRDRLGGRGSEATAGTLDAATETTRSTSIGSTREAIQAESEDEIHCADSTRKQSTPLTFVAIADFEGLSENTERNVFTLQQDEQVEVMEQSESGWWLVRKYSEDIGAENDQYCGYVPASYLRKSCSDAPNEAFKSLDDDCLIPVFGQTIVVSNEMLTEDPQEPTNDIILPTIKKSPLNRLRNEFLYGFSDSEQSTCSSERSDSSQEISEMTGRIGDLKMSRCRSATSSPSMLERFLNPSGLSPKMHSSQRRNTLAVPLVIENMSRSSSTGNIVMHLQGEEYICKKSFVATSNEEMSFNEGSVVKVLRRNSDGWWMASYNGKTGLVPGVHLQKYKDPIRRMSIHMMHAI